MTGNSFFGRLVSPGGLQRHSSRLSFFQAITSNINVFRVSRIVSGGDGVIVVNTKNCPRCEHQAILRPRSFSDQAIASLVSWGDMDKKIIGHPICDDCHDELRDALIEHQRAAAEKEVQLSRLKNKRAG